MSEAYIGHITSVECDDDYGRHWASFDATGADAPTVAAETAAYIQRLVKRDALSDIDCSGQCPCTRPVAGCAECARWDLACGDHRDTYRP